MRLVSGSCVDKVFRQEAECGERPWTEACLHNGWVGVLLYSVSDDKQDKKGLYETFFSLLEVVR